MIYQILIRVLSPVVLLLTLMDGLKRKAEKTFVLKRLGFFIPNLEPQSNRVWVHCASVGEVKAAEPLLNWMIQSNQTNVIVTTNTASGLSILNRQFGTQLTATYCPLDYPFAIRRFLKQCRPAELFIIETEIWPNLYQQCFQNHIPVHIVSGRISQKTLQAPNWLKTRYKQALQQVTQVLARSENDAQSFIKLGANPEQVKVLGNLKFAQLRDEHFENPIERAYVLAASTHEDEEIQIAKCWQSLNRQELLVIVPRHPNRSSAIQQTLKDSGFQFKVASHKDPIEATDEILLDDRIGHLIPLFQHAKLVIMGGSFVNQGGHNFIEPARFKKAILTGPDYRNFKNEFALLESFNGILACQNYTQLKAHMLHLLNHPLETEKLGNQAFQAIQTQKKTLNHYIAALHLHEKPH